MKRMLVTIALMLATYQPLLALPNLCRMAGGQLTVTCAHSCADRPCCAVQERQERPPVAAVPLTNSDPFVATVPVVLSLIVATPADVRGGFAKVASSSHAPAPRTLSGIQLI